MNSEQEKELASQLLKLFENSANWERPFQAKMVNPKNPISGTRYTGINWPILFATAQLRGYILPEFATFRQWAERGIFVKKGEKAQKIVYCGTLYENADGERITQEQYRADIDHEIVYQKVYAVFNREQTDAEPIEIEQKKPAFESIRKYFENCHIKTVRRPGGAYYIPEVDLVSTPPLDDFRCENEYWATTAHEYAHATAHGTRLKRDVQYQGEGRALEELAAEFGGALFCAKLGIPYMFQKNNVAYMAAWAKRASDAPKTILAAVREGARAADWLFSKSGAPEIEDVLAPEFA